MEKAEDTSNLRNVHDELEMTTEDLSEDTVGQPVPKDNPASKDHCTFSACLWKPIFKHRALLFVLLAAFCSALESILARFVTQDVHAIQVSFTRFLLQLFPLISLLSYSGISPKADSKSVLAMLIIRALVGAFSTISFYYALYFTNVGNATAVTYGSPVFVVFFARIILKETVGIIDAVLAIVVIGGVLLISQPPFLFGGGGGADASREVIGALLSLCACVSVSFTITLTAKMGKFHVNSFKIVFYYAAVASVAAALLATILRVWSLPPCGSVRFALVGMGVLCCSHQCLQTYSLSIEKSVYVSIVRTNEVIFAYVLEFFLFNTSPDIVPLIGAGIIMAASITASWRKMWLSKKKNVTNQRQLEISNHGTEEYNQS